MAWAGQATLVKQLLPFSGDDNQYYLIVNFFVAL
jgi:hypothetical protein